MIILWWYFLKNLWKAKVTWHWFQKYAILLKRTIHWSLNSMQPRTVQKDSFPLHHGSFGYIWNIWYQWSQCIVKYQNTLYFLCIMDHLDKSKNTKINHIFSLLWIIRIHLNICNIWSHYIGNGPYKACITFMKRYHSWCAI